MARGAVGGERLEDVEPVRFSPPKLFPSELILFFSRSAVNQFCVNVTLYGLSTFMPIIIRGLQLTTNPVFAQLLTVPGRSL